MQRSTACALLISRRPAGIHTEERPLSASAELISLACYIRVLGDIEALMDGVPFVVAVLLDSVAVVHHHLRRLPREREKTCV